jgi:hypothetical protein
MHQIGLNCSATYDPDALKALGETFDSAWASVAHNFGDLSREAARLEMAMLILEFAADGYGSYLELKCRAIGAISAARGLKVAVGNGRLSTVVTKSR